MLRGALARRPVESLRCLWALVALGCRCFCSAPLCSVFWAFCWGPSKVFSDRGVSVWRGRRPAMGVAPLVRTGASKVLDQLCRIGGGSVCRAINWANCPPFPPISSVPFLAVACWSVSSRGVERRYSITRRFDRLSIFLFVCVSLLAPMCYSGAELGP